MSRYVSRLLLIALGGLGASHLAYAFFSTFVSLSPATDAKHPAIRPTLEIDGSTITVRVPVPNKAQRSWLIVADERLPGRQQNFRNAIWSDDRSMRAGLQIDEIGRLLFWRDFVVVKLNRRVAERAYVYVDYPKPLFDGGYYYSIDIPAYLNAADKSRTGPADRGR